MTGVLRDAPVAPDIGRCVEEGLRLGLGPAIACIGSVRGQIFHHQALGVLAPPARAPCTHRTLFDLGDLTMPLAAGLAAMWGVGRRRVELTAPIGRVLPDFAAPAWEAVTLAHLLEHTSGLPARMPLHVSLAAAQRLLHPKERSWGTPGAAPALARFLAAAPPAAGHSGQLAPLRSGPGYMLLGWALERLFSLPLDSWLKATVLAPLAVVDEVMFRPATDVARLRAAVGPMCPVRKRVLLGEAADLNASAQGGVAGHAGLFASASGVWSVAQAMLAAHHGENALFQPATVMRFWSRARRAGGNLPRRCVGFVAPQAALWIDPAAHFVGVVLTSQPAASPAAAGMEAFLARLFERFMQASAISKTAVDVPPTWEQVPGH